MKKVLVCGGRDFKDLPLMEAALNEFLKPGDILMHGAAPGADKLAAKLAGLTPDVEIWRFPAQWTLYGKSAGPLRNQEMLNANPNIVIAMPGGKGTEDMVGRAERRNIRVVRAIRDEKGRIKFKG